MDEDDLLFGDELSAAVVPFPGTENTTTGESRRAYEDDLALFQELLEREEETHWEQAQVAALMEAKYGEHTAKAVAGDTGLSASYVRMLTATYKAFPTDESRVPDLSFSHHRIAAVTADPARWIRAAADNDWSCGDLRKAIAETKDRMDEFARARKAEDQIVRAARKYNEQFSRLTGKTVTVLWNAAQERAAG